MGPVCLKQKAGPGGGKGGGGGCKPHNSLFSLTNSRFFLPGFL